MTCLFHGIFRSFRYPFLYRINMIDRPRYAKLYIHRPNQRSMDHPADPEDVPPAVLPLHQIQYYQPEFLSHYP